MWVPDSHSGIPLQSHQGEEYGLQLEINDMENQLISNTNPLIDFSAVPEGKPNVPRMGQYLNPNVQIGIHEIQQHHLPTRMKIFQN